jgi:four helix bundle protein
MLPKTVAGTWIAGQMVDSATSSGANYEEACAPESRSDFIHKMSVALKELKETRYWLKVIHKTEMAGANVTQPLLSECEQLCAIMGRSVSTAKKNKISMRNHQ